LGRCRKPRMAGSELCEIASTMLMQ
jgi:hypothetical protein